MTKQKYIFIGGAHKSGSTLLSKILGQSEEISSLEFTGVPMDEGQWLQSCLQQDVYFGELLFGLSEESHLTENNLKMNNEITEKILNDWNPFWDTTSKFLLEKSPINVVRTRFLQSLFPNSIFLITIRDPRTSYMAAKKIIPHISAKTYFDNWYSIYSIFKEDSKYLNSFEIISYESLIAQPQKVLMQIKKLFNDKINFEFPVDVSPSIDIKYLNEWNKQYKNQFCVPNIYNYGEKKNIKYNNCNTYLSRF